MLSQVSSSTIAPSVFSFCSRSLESSSRISFLPTWIRTGVTPVKSLLMGDING